MNPAAFKTRVNDFTLITHSVPSERVRHHLPRDLELETYKDAQGTERAFVSVGLFFNRNFHWSPAPKPSLNFYQCTYRTYIRYKGRRAVYFFKTYLQTLSSYVMQRTIMHSVLKGRFNVAASRGLQGYQAYSASIISLADGHTEFEFDAIQLPIARPPFHSGEELSQFLYNRLHGIFRSSAGLLFDQVVEHRRIYPWSGTLKSARFDPWVRLGILTRDEVQKPYSVLVEPSVELTLYPPVPIRWLSDCKDPRHETKSIEKSTAA